MKKYVAELIGTMVLVLLAAVAPYLQEEWPTQWVPV